MKNRELERSDDDVSPRLYLDPVQLQEFGNVGHREHLIDEPADLTMDSVGLKPAAVVLSDHASIPDREGFYDGDEVPDIVQEISEGTLFYIRCEMLEDEETPLSELQVGLVIVVPDLLDTLVS